MITQEERTKMHEVLDRLIDYRNKNVSEDPADTYDVTNDIAVRHVVSYGNDQSYVDETYAIVYRLNDGQFLSEQSYRIVKKDKQERVERIYIF